jgi:hypothetical protein
MPEPHSGRTCHNAQIHLGQPHAKHETRGALVEPRRFPWNDHPDNRKKKKAKETLSLLTLEHWERSQGYIWGIERRMPAKWRDQQSLLLEPRSQEPRLRPSFHHPAEPTTQLVASSKPRATAARRKWQRHVVGGRADNRPVSCAAFMHQHQLVLFRASHRLRSTACPECRTTALPSIRPTAVN